jgi:hypothetical protein
MISYLGGKCAKCDCIDGLQFDHINPKTKSFGVSENWGRSWDILVKELDKCQLLCREHHKEKTKANKEYGGGQNKFTECPHGTVYGYSGRWKCRCDLCRKAKSDAYKKLRYGT